MNCRTICEHLSAYLDDELAPELAERVREHLASCATCRTELDSLRELTGVLHALPHEPAPESVEQEVVLYIEEDILLRKPDRARWTTIAARTLTGLGAVAAALLVGLSAYMYFASFDESPTDVTVADYDLATKAGQDDMVAGVTVNGRIVAQDGRTDAFRDQALEPSVKHGGEQALALIERYAKGGESRLPEGKLLESKVGTRLEMGRKAGEGLDKPVGALTTPLAEPVQVKATFAETTQPASVVTALAPVPAFEGAQLNDGDALVTAKKPAEPEFLDLDLVDDDFDAARAHVIAVAASLGIPRAEGEYAYYFAAEGKHVGGDVGVLAGTDTQAAHGRTGEVLSSKELEARRGDPYAGRSTGKARPAVVLVVDEEKLPGLVAKLAAPRARRAAGPVTGLYTSGVAKTDAEKPDAVGRISTTRGLKEKSEGLEDVKKTEPAKKPEKDVTGQVLDELERMRREESARPRTTETQTPRPTAETPAVKPQPTPADRDADGKDDAGVVVRRTPAPTEAEKRTPAEPSPGEVFKKLGERKLVYLRIYLKHPPAKPLPAARTTPATK